MNRVSVLAVTIASTAAAAAAVTMGPAMAAARPAAARPAAHAAHAARAARARTIGRATTAVELASLAAGQQAIPGLSSASIAAESDGGKYLTVVHCAGVDTPPPIRVGAPGTPLTASGTGPSAGLLAMLSRPNPYKTVYTCTVSIEMKAAARPAKTAPKKPGCEIGAASGGAAGGRAGAGCTKTVTLNTGFGGMAGTVAHHHPAG